MTLRELYSQVRGKKSKEKIRKYQLLARHERQIARYATTMGGGSIKVSIRVFESGYVLYEEDDKNTVFHLSEICDIGSLYETTDNALVSYKQRMIPAEVYMSADWTLRVILEGNDRIMYNAEKLKKDWQEFSYSGISEDMVQLGFTVDFFKEIEEEISYQKMLDVFRIVQDAMKPIQWDVYVMIKRDGKKEREIAEELGKTQQAVSKDYIKAKETIDSLREALKQMFYED